MARLFWSFTPLHDRSPRWLPDLASSLAQDAGCSNVGLYSQNRITAAKAQADRNFGTAVKPPFLYSFVCGMHRANQNAVGYHPSILASYVQMLPPGALFSALGVGPVQHPATVQSLLLGGGVRVGFEDSTNYRKGEPAKSNAQMVERIVNVIRDLGFEPATSEEARDMLGVPQLGTPESIETRHPEYRRISEPA